jgi:hypothetical protein
MRSAPGPDRGTRPTGPNAKKKSVSFGFSRLMSTPETMSLRAGRGAVSPTVSASRSLSVVAAM